MEINKQLHTTSQTALNAHAKVEGLKKIQLAESTRLTMEITNNREMLHKTEALRQDITIKTIA